MQIKFLSAAALVAVSAVALAGAEQNANVSLMDWRRDQFEPKSPVLEKPETTRGFHGRVAPLVRIHGGNAAGCESNRVLRMTAWRNERVSAQAVVWDHDALLQLRLSASAITNCAPSFWFGTKQIPDEAVSLRFVRYVMARERLIGDALDHIERVDSATDGFRPFWITIKVPKNADAGLYKGLVTAVAKGGQKKLEFPVELTVVDATLPDPEEWSYFLDLWQHPWAIARYHGVKPFSERHYSIMRPIWEELAQGGQKTITTTISKLPWNHQNFDGYDTMVVHTKHADGTFTHDYSLFDEYVEFCQDCGLGPQIHCYSMSTWGNRVYWFEENGDLAWDDLPSGSEKHRAFWGPFLKDFSAHLDKKGWLERTYMAMDERSPKEVKAVYDLVKEFAPRLKLAMAANQLASNFKGIDIHTFSVDFNHANNDAFVAEAAQRRAAGMATTFYICCSPGRPNTFTASPLEESPWLALYAAATGFDGMLRWAFANWPRDPLFDTTFNGWAPGDTFLYYPGNRASVRWEMVRDGIEEFEKIALLRREGADMTKIDALLQRIRAEGCGKAGEHVEQMRELTAEAGASL